LYYGGVGVLIEGYAGYAGYAGYTGYDGFYGDDASQGAAGYKLYSLVFTIGILILKGPCPVINGTNLVQAG